MTKENAAANSTTDEAEIGNENEQLQQVGADKQTIGANTNELSTINNHETNTPSNNSNSNSAALPKSAKANGLKNRIIQRPPPLILDKVSNFYDNLQRENQSVPIMNSNTTTNEAKYRQQPTHQDNYNKQQSFNGNSKPQTVVTANNKTTANMTTSDTTTNSANHKFWASLNRNVSRARANANRVSSSLDNGGQIDAIDSGGNLGADLIITRRGSDGRRDTSCIVQAPMAIQKQTSQKQKRQKQQSATAHDAEGSIDNRNDANKFSNVGHPVAGPKATDNDLSNRVTPNSPTKAHDMSNLSSEPDEGGATSENGTSGGNLIGVDNPPTPTLSNANDDPPASASSSRPRSNNPFLSMDDGYLPQTDSPIPSTFHKRPASFIAATEKGQRIIQAIDNNNQRRNIQPVTTTPQNIQTYFDKLHIDDVDRTPHNFESPNPNNAPNSDSNTHDHESVYVGAKFMNHQYDLTNQNTSTPLYRPVPISSSQILEPQHQLDNQQHAQQMASSSQQHHPHHLHHQQQNLHQPIYNIHSPNSRFNNNGEPTISLDSESTICQPPPSATMQLPYWTDAIYELNNAILETRSVVGGAENGQFIQVAESGDIILEIDRIKVSGYTLEEFNGLLESKPVHLLHAVQTKHCHGLSIVLRSFLSQSFPKDSIERELQNIIRENVYRRTIPCTTRPPKNDEVDGVDYHFLSQDQFVKLNSLGILLECGMYGGHYYGTMRPMVNLHESLICGSNQPKNTLTDMSQPLMANHPALLPSQASRKDQPTYLMNSAPTESLYENNESLKMNQGINQNTMVNYAIYPNRSLPQINPLPSDLKQPSTIVAVDSEALPHGWERVIDQTHGTYYIDHITRQTQYERPYEVELTKGAMGFGFTLVEADDGLLLVRSIIPGGPAYANGSIRPGDILVSAVGVSVYGLAHTDVARLFSTFAMGDRIRLTFARSSYVVDTNLVPDEYLISNGTNGDLAITVNPNYHTLTSQHQQLGEQSPYISVNQEYELIFVTLKRGDSGFGFTIVDSIAGQKVREIQNNEVCANLKQGDILISLNGQDITKLTHKEVVEKLKNCPAGKDVTLTVKRKKRFRSKTPVAMPSENKGDFPANRTPQRNCKTPSVDSLMLRRTSQQADSVVRPLFTSAPNQLPLSDPPLNSNGLKDHPMPPAGFDSVDTNYVSMSQPIYGVHPLANQEQLYYNNPVQPMSLPTNYNYDMMPGNSYPQGPASLTNSDGLILDNRTSSVNPSEASIPSVKTSHASGLGQMNKYHSFMNNDKLMMVQMQQSQFAPIISQQSSTDYHPLPLYTNCETLKQQQSQPEPIYGGNYQCNYYANNEEIAMQQRMLFANGGMTNLSQRNDNLYQLPGLNQQAFAYGQSISNNGFQQYNFDELAPIDPDECEYHQVDLDRENIDSNWGIRLIGGSEVGRAISVGSIVSGGAASKNGLLKPGDEIIAINGNNVVGATHQHVVELISACSNRASLVIRRKKFAEACEVILNKNSDEGFGFVIISSGNCALIGRIITGSPADRCKQLHVRDRIIAVNGRYITPDMQHPEIVNMIKECGSTLRLRIIPVDCYTVELIKSAPSDNFGFSMRGGSEYDGTPLYILRVAPNGLARDLLNVGDQIIEINGISTVGMTHQQAATIIKYSHPIVKLKLRRNYVTPPSLLVDSPRALQKFNQVTAEMKTVHRGATPNSFTNNDCSHLLTVPIES